MIPRTFTIGQANALVPFLEAQFKEARRLVEELKGLRARSRPSSRRPSVFGRATVVASPEFVERIAATEKAIHRILDETTELGIEVRRVDGLADFPSWHDGQLVHLCWRYGESEIGFYHPQSTGFDSRRPLATTAPRDCN